MTEETAEERKRRWRLELEREDQQRAIDHARRAHDEMAEFAGTANKAAIDNVGLVFRSLLLINGGAAVSVLAFVGGLISQGKFSLGAQAAGVAHALLLFAFGALASAAGTGLAYFTHLSVAGHALTVARQWDPPFVVETPTSRRWFRGSIIFLSLAIVSGIAAAALFLCGIVEVSHAITQSAVRLPADGS
jgi:hypothetical protein